MRGPVKSKMPNAEILFYKDCDFLVTQEQNVKCPGPHALLDHSVQYCLGYQHYASLTVSYLQVKKVQTVLNKLILSCPKNV